MSACQPYDALVSTPAGLIPIGELVEDDAVGTKVYDATGLTKIVATKANGVKDVLRLHTNAGYTLDVTADHLVWRAADTEPGGSFRLASSPRRPAGMASTDVLRRSGDRFTRWLRPRLPDGSSLTALWASTTPARIAR